MLSFLPLRAQAATPPPPSWPDLSAQLRGAHAPTGSALAKLIADNQDFSMLRPEEAHDTIRVPPWLRVWWRRNHPEAVYSAADPTGGYPLVLKEAYEWMVLHPDLKPGIAARDAEPSGTGKAWDGTLDLRAAVSGEERISGSFPSSPRSESDIRVNYWDPTKMIGASNDIAGAGQAQFYSADGGATWGQTTLPLQPGDAFDSDPTVEWTSDGTAWATTIGINSGATSLQMRAYKSIDDGATWTFDATFSTGSNNDKQLIWTDHSDSSPYEDHLYAIWHNGNPAYMNRRTGPAGSWGTPIQVSGAESSGTCIGDDVRTNAYGDVFGFWPTTGNGKIFVVKSTDGGTSYGTPVQVATTFDTFDIGIPAMNSRRALIYVSGSAYRTATKNLVYAAWTDLSGDTGCTAPGNEPGSNTAATCKTRIWFARSADGGATWSAKVKLNDQAGKNDQLNQAMVVDDTSGAIEVVYYDTVGDANRLKVDLWQQSSFDDGVTWTTPVKVTSAQTDETGSGADLGNQFGDYNSISGLSGVFFPTWSDRRGGAREEIWTAKVDDPACTAPGTPAIGAASASADNHVQVSWGNGTPGASSFEIYRALGTCAAPGPFELLASGVSASPYDDATVSGGVTYAYRVVGKDETDNCHSSASTCAEVTATGACTLSPVFTGLTSASNAATGVCATTLSWSGASAQCAGSVTYDVFRSTDSGFTPALANRIATGVTGTTFDDSDGLADGTSYTYVVRAVDGSNGQSDANTVRKSVQPTGPIATVTLTDGFEGSASGGGFDLDGWSHQALSGATDWVVASAQAQSPTHDWFSADQTSTSDRVLVSPSFVPLAGSTLSFWHTYAFEGSLAQCYDAGTLEISTDGGTTWTVVPDAAFTAGGFTGTANGSFQNPIGGKRAWCAGAIGAMTEVTASLGSFASANQARLRWHEGDDSSVTATGWYVDSVALTGVGTAGVCTSTTAIFSDGFESAGTGAWSHAVP